jgi:hypothetical protein
LDWQGIFGVVSRFEYEQLATAKLAASTKLSKQKVPLQLKHPMPPHVLRDCKCWQRYNS